MKPFNIYLELEAEGVSLKGKIDDLLKFNGIPNNLIDLGQGVGFHYNGIKIKGEPKNLVHFTEDKFKEYKNNIANYLRHLVLKDYIK